MAIQRSVGWVALVLGSSCWLGSPVDARTFSAEAEFLQAVAGPTTVSFNQFPVGFLPQTTLHLGAVTVILTNSGSAPIFGPGQLGFTTNFLSTGVDSNNVVITVPVGTRAVGMKLASPSENPITLTANYVSAMETVTFRALEASFLGFSDPSGLQSIRISSTHVLPTIPIVNIGDITFASQFAPPVPVPTAVGIPTLSEIGYLILALTLVLFAWMSVRARSTAPASQRRP